MRALGYESGPDRGRLWTRPERLRLIARNLRRRGQWRIAAGIEALASMDECGRAAAEESDNGAARALLRFADFHADRARRLLT
jgi:hypothetical protein